MARLDLSTRHLCARIAQHAIRRRRLPGAIRARDVRAADLQEEPTKRIASRADSSRQSFRRIRRRRRLLGEHRREHSEPSDTASAASGAINTGSRAAVLSQAGAPLSWTSERADTFFVGERVRKAAAHKRQPQRAERATYRQ